MATTFKPEDFPKMRVDYPAEVDLLCKLLNAMSQDVVRTGFVRQQKDVLIGVGQAYPVTVVHDLKTKPVGVLVLQAYESTDRDIRAIGEAVHVDWVAGNQAVVINGVTGLDAAKSYVLKLMVL